MAKYRLNNVATLARQMNFTPPKARLTQLSAAEELLHVIEPNKAYPYDFVIFRITGYRPRKASQELLAGLALQHDLGLLIEQLSDSLNIRSDAAAEPVLSIDDVSERFNVTSKTIQRWRRRGLPARRLVFPDGKRRVGFLVSSVERFFALHREQLDAGTNFSCLTDSERDEIFRRARRLAATGSCSTSEIVRRVARKLNRSPATILHTVRRHDAAYPDSAIFANAPEPIGEEGRSEIMKAHRQGMPLRELARRLHRRRSEVYRVIVEQRLARLSRRKIRFIDDPLYHQPDSEKLIDAIVAQQELPAALRPEDSRVPRDLPPYLQDLYRTPLLSPPRERALFLKFNFHRRQFVQTRRRIDPQLVRLRDLDYLESLWRKVVKSKNEIVQANLRLVVSVARKHLRANLSLMELISDGNLTLMRAVDGFDIHRGHKFSTYATLALMKGFARSVPNMLSSSRATREAMLADLADARAGSAAEGALERAELRHSLQRLDDRERTVILSHFGLDRSPATYEEVGRRLGLSKQRVRQIEQTALSKLRAHLAAVDPPQISR